MKEIMMLNKFLIAAALAVTPLLMSDTVSAGGHCHRGGYGGGYGGYGGGYGGAVVSYRAPVYGHRQGHYRPYRAAGYRSYYGSPYRSYYGRGYGGYGYGGGYYGRGNAIGINRGGVSLYFGF
jgi:hypothetical protein